jgi:hypothetical protein
VLLVPAMLVRNDLKQYTADACFALLTLAITARTEGAAERCEGRHTDERHRVTEEHAAPAGSVERGVTQEGADRDTNR